MNYKIRDPVDEFISSFKERLQCKKIILVNSIEPYYFSFSMPGESVLSIMIESIFCFKFYDITLTIEGEDTELSRSISQYLGKGLAPPIKKYLKLRAKQEQLNNAQLLNDLKSPPIKELRDLSETYFL